MRLITLAVAMTCVGYSYSQKVYTKDGIPLKSSDLLKPCIEGFKGQAFDLKGAEFSGEAYCSCVVYELIPRIHYKDLVAAVNNGTILDLFMKKENFKIILDCVESNVEFKKNTVIVDPKIDTNYTKKQQALFQKRKEEIQIEVIENCVNNLINSPDNLNISRQVARKYCTCAMDKIYKSGITYGEMLELDNINSNAYNEVIEPCLILAINQNDDKGKIENIDVIGKFKESRVPLIVGLDNTYKLKLSIGNKSMYFIFDTGASDMIIDHNLERELLLQGILERKNYRNKKSYTLANGEKVEAQQVIIDSIQIGDYIVNNVKVGIIDDGAFLCGKSLLDKFGKWELDTRNNQLILFK
jgi:clan AA aspartic protease (TIGR02281 family)